MYSILEEASKSFWREVGKDAIKKAVATVVTEGIKAQFHVWQQLKLKRERHDMDRRFREEDEARESIKKTRQEREPSDEPVPMDNEPPIEEGPAEEESVGEEVHEAEGDDEDAWVLAF